MRILQIITRNELRGAEVFAAQLSERLVQRGHQVVLASLYAPPNDVRERLSCNGTECVELLGKTKGRIEQAVIRRLSKLIRANRPDIVQANAFHALKYAALLKRMTVGSWPLAYRNVSMASHWISGNWRRQWGQWLLQSVEQVLSVSDSAATDFCVTYGYPRARAITIKRGVEIPREVNFSASRGRIADIIGCNEQDPLLFHLGGFTPEKNHEGLLRAFTSIHEQIPHARLVLCGEGPLREFMEKRAAQLGVDRNVYFLGARPDARELLAGADLLLLTSHVEGIPGVILEAGARMVPSVATNVGAVSDAVRDRSTGILVPAGDMVGLASAVCELLTHGDSRRKMGLAAHDFVVESHEINKSVDRFEEIYRALSGTIE